MPRLIGAAAGLLTLIAAVLAGAAEPVVTELTLEDGGMQRLLYAAPDNPRAILLMLPGGNGMVEFGPDGGFRRMGELCCCAHCRCGRRRASPSRS